MKKLAGLILFIICSSGFYSNAQSVSNVTVSGLFFVDKLLTGDYSEDLTGLTGPYTYTYEWMSAPASGGLATTISGAPNSLYYTIGSSVFGKRIQFKVTIVDDNGVQISDSSSLSPVVGANTAPYASGVSISQFPANLNVGTTFYGDYTYTDNEDDSEGTSLYRWLRSDNQTGPYSDEVSTNRAYTLDNSDQGSWFKFEVTPVAANGVSPGAVELSSEIGPINSAPSVSNVTIFGSAEAESTVKARYDYSDVDGDNDISSFQWYLNNVPIGGATDSAYTILGSDEGSTLKVTVTPRSETGLPDTGTPQSASVSLGHSSLPEALNVCISGRRQAGATLSGKWEYSFDNSSGDQISEQKDSKTEWLFDGLVVKTSLDSDFTDSSPQLTSADLSKEIIFRITPKAKNGAEGLPVSSDEMAIFKMSKTEYSQDNADVELIATPAGGEFACFSNSSAVSGNYFRPGELSVGDYSIRYSVDITLGENTYNQKAWITLSVTEALSFFDSFEDYYCKGQGRLDTIYVRNTTHYGPKLAWNFTMSDPDAIVGFINDTSVIVSIDNINAGTGKDYLFYTYTTILSTFGVSPQYFVIDSVGQNLAISIPDTAYCQEEDAVLINSLNHYPSGGSGAWSGVLVRDWDDYTSILDPSQVLAAGINYVDYTYNSPLGCSFTVRDSVIINPTPMADFQVDDRCLDFAGDTTWFTNISSCTDSISGWSWSFDETSGSSSAKEPAYVYQSGGTKFVSLIASTVKGCVDTLTRSILIARKPLSDFRWEDDCYYENEDLLLFDNSDFTESVDSVRWVINDATTWKKQGISFDTAYIKQNEPEIIKVDYILETPVTGCLDTMTKEIYIRPVFTISEDDYFEGFDTDRLGWFNDASPVNKWTKGIPERFGADPASTDTAWFTSYDMLNQVESAYSVESPCFDFRGVERPMISMDIMRRFDRGRDGAVLQYRVGNDETWENIGGTFYGINWYQNTNIFGRPGESVVGWSAEEEDDTWVEARQYLDELIGLYDVKLRIAYGSAGPSEGYVENEGFAFDDITISERKRNVLIEHFTNSNVANSASADILVNDIVEGAPKDALNIQYHTNHVQGDPFYIENTADPSARILYYGLSTVPYALYDGGFNTVDSWARKYTFETGYEADINHLRNRSLIDPLFEISVDSIRPAVYEVNMRAMEDLETEDLTLFIAIIADKATSPVIDNGQTVFRNVLRKMYPDAGGEAIVTSWITDDVATYGEFSLSDILADNYDIDTIRVIAFLQNTYTKEIYQAAVSPPLDATITSTGKVRFEEAEFSLFPNPASSNLTLLFDSEIRANSRLTILNSTGVAVKEIELQPGIDSLTIDDLNLPTGFYMVQVVIDGKGAGLRKLIVSNR